MTGCQADVSKIARQILNRSIAHRTIPKQECMVELAQLPLVICTESFETVNLSGSYRLTSSTHYDLISRYRRMAPANPNMSLHHFVQMDLNKRKSKIDMIPHYVGANGQPKYPPTKEYAMAVLLVHQPWANASPPRLSDEQWIARFQEFITSPQCPKGVALEYARVKERHMSKRPEEVVATEECYDTEIRANMDDRTKDILSIVTNHSRPSDPYFSMKDHRFDRGLNYDWSAQHWVSEALTRLLARHHGIIFFNIIKYYYMLSPTQAQGDNSHNEAWLLQTIVNHQAERDESYKPFTMTINGRTEVMDISHAKDDQLSIVIAVMKKLKEWTECSTTNDPDLAQSFHPMRMTIRGSAGAGKSFLIKSLANSIREIFGERGVVHIVAPTGAAAYNVGGETLHRTWAINPHKPSQPLHETTKERLIANHKHTICVIADERSMLTSDVIGAAERNTSASTHGGAHDSEDWGGVPIVILVGDDYQLPPPTNTQKGAFDTMDTRSSYSQQRLEGTASFGSDIFTQMSEHCMELTSVKRQNSTQSRFKEILARLRTGHSTLEDAEFLLSRHLSNYTPAEVHEILNNSGVVMHLFATKAPRDEFNYQRLSEVSSGDNPVALLKAQWTSVRGRSTTSIIDHFKDPPNSATLLCRGAMVRIVGRNFEPRWGLYNNAIGTVVDIVFQPGDDPNSGNLPLYVAVEFQHYVGPTWDPRNPKVRIFEDKQKYSSNNSPSNQQILHCIHLHSLTQVVPIPMITHRCEKSCCSVQFCPLELSFGMTLHTFQGQSAGPVEEGQPSNAVDVIVVDPGTRTFEGNNPGLLYMGVSRATTAGTNKRDSALFFTGPNMNRARIMGITYQKGMWNGRKKLYKKVELRERWVTRLIGKTVKPSFTQDEIANITQWSREYRMNTEQLDNALNKTAWRANMRRCTNY